MTRIRKTAALPVVKREAPTVANPGSALGEAIGALIEREVHRILRPITEENNCSYITIGQPNPRTGADTKLLLTDTKGTKYQIDAVIANQQMQPLVLIESKYIRYIKHNRDKGSWICTAHYSLRRRYPTVRKSIAVLVGAWSKTSKAMMEGFDVSLFEVGFDKIVDALAKHGVDFKWGEKEHHKAILAWQHWQQLTDAQYAQIAKELLGDVEPALRIALKETLDTAIPRKIKSAEILIQTSLGEMRHYTFESMETALRFLQNFDEAAFLKDEDGPSLFQEGALPKPKSKQQTPKKASKKRKP